MSKKPASPEPKILHGDAYPVELRLAIAMAVRLTFTMQAIEHHAEENNPAGVLKCVTTGQEALFGLIMHIAKSQGCDMAATFDYWLDKVVPDVPLREHEKFLGEE